MQVFFNVLYLLFYCSVYLGGGVGGWGGYSLFIYCLITLYMFLYIYIVHIVLLVSLLEVPTIHLLVE